MDKGLIVHTIILDDQHQALVIKRSAHNDVLPNFWDVPGGTLHDGEDPSEGALREVREEVGLTVQKPDLFFFTSNVDEGKNKQFVRLIFLTAYTDGPITLNPDEHDAYKWIDVRTSTQLPLVDYLPGCFALLTTKGHALSRLL